MARKKGKRRKKKESPPRGSGPGGGRSSHSTDDGGWSEEPAGNADFSGFTILQLADGNEEVLNTWPLLSEDEQWEVLDVGEVEVVECFKELDLDVGLEGPSKVLDNSEYMTTIRSLFLLGVTSGGLVPMNSQDPVAGMLLHIMEEHLMVAYMRHEVQIRTMLRVLVWLWLVQSLWIGWIAWFIGTGFTLFCLASVSPWALSVREALATPFEHPDAVTFEIRANSMHILFFLMDASFWLPGQDFAVHLALTMIPFAITFVRSRQAGVKTLLNCAYYLVLVDLLYFSLYSWFRVLLIAFLFAPSAFAFFVRYSAAAVGIGLSVFNRYVPCPSLAIRMSVLVVALGVAYMTTVESTRDSIVRFFTVALSILFAMPVTWRLMPMALCLPVAASFEKPPTASRVASAVFYGVAIGLATLVIVLQFVWNLRITRAIVGALSPCWRPPLERLRDWLATSEQSDGSEQENKQNGGARAWDSGNE